MSELTPYLCVTDARAAIEWYAAALGAVVTYEPIVMLDNRIGHVELSFDGAPLMLSDEFDDAGVASPMPGRGNDVTLHLTVSDVDAVAAAVAENDVSLGTAGRAPVLSSRSIPSCRPAASMPRLLSVTPPQWPSTSPGTRRSPGRRGARTAGRR